MPPIEKYPFFAKMGPIMIYALVVWVWVWVCVVVVLSFELIGYSIPSMVKTLYQPSRSGKICVVWSLRNLLAVSTALRNDNFNTQSRGFRTSRDLVARRLTYEWTEANYLTDTRQDHIWWLASVASFTKEVNSRLAKRPLVFNGRLANRGLTS